MDNLRIDELQLGSGDFYSPTPEYTTACCGELHLEIIPLKLPEISVSMFARIRGSAKPPG
jgi:hypothetical protein